MYYGISQLKIGSNNYICEDSSLIIRIKSNIQRVSTSVSRVFTPVNGLQIERTYELTMNLTEAAAIELAIDDVAGGDLSHEVVYSQFQPLGLFEQINSQPNRFAAFVPTTYNESTAPHGSLGPLRGNVTCVMLGLDEELLTIEGDFTATRITALTGGFFTVTGLITDIQLSNTIPIEDTGGGQGLGGPELGP